MHAIWWVLAGLACGFIFGIAAAARAPDIRYLVEPIMTVRESDLPQPVTPPPPGMVWAFAQTTGYCPCTICCGKNDGITASGRNAYEYPWGIAAGRLSWVPKNTWMMVPGYGYALVDDTGGAMRQSAKRGIIHLDLRFVTHQNARRWGVRRMWIAIPAGSELSRLAAEQ